MFTENPSASTAVLNPRKLNEDLRGKRFGRVLVVDSIDSTNTALFELGRAGEPEGLILLAEEQLAGRGRMGRRWTSPKGKSVLMSALARPAIAQKDAALLSAVAGLAVLDAIGAECSLQASLKWPNDIVFEGRKLGGILIESGTDNDANAFFVIGIGINVEWRVEDFPTEIAETATAISIELSSSPPHRGALVVAIASNLGEWVSTLESDPKTLRDRYKKSLSTLGSRVRVRLSTEEIEGVAEDIDDHGDLVVRCDSGVRRVVVTGEVSELRSA